MITAVAAPLWNHRKFRAQSAELADTLAAAESTDMDRANRARKIQLAKRQFQLPIVARIGYREYARDASRVEACSRDALRTLLYSGWIGLPSGVRT